MVDKRYLCGPLLAVLIALGDGVSHAENAWEPGSANDPNSCRELWQAVGLPKYRPSAEATVTVVCHTRFVLSHNDLTKTPDWVVEHLTRDAIGSALRPKVDFKSEANVAPAARASDRDYTNSDFDRGHQAPSDDFSQNAEWMAESFVLSNVVPQVGPGFNQHIWARLEEYVRDLLDRRKELYVITGPVYQDAEKKEKTISAEQNLCGNAIKLSQLKKASICEENNKNPQVRCEGGVAVPAGIYKILYDPQAKQANAYLMPNMDHREQPGYRDTIAYLNKFRTTVEIVEEYTGLQFFAAIPLRDRRRLTDRCQSVMIR